MMTSQTQIQQTTPNKKLATVALAGLLAMGTFSAAPAFAGSHSNGCGSSSCKGKKAPVQANGCGSKPVAGAKNACKAASKCKSMDSANTKNACKSMNKCKSMNGCGGKTHESHEDNGRYND